MSLKKDNPYLQKEGDRLIVTEIGHQKLSEIVTDPTGQVYAFKFGSLSPVIVAAAMARLSRRAGDMRLTVLDEFVEPEDAEFLLRRVISQFGDDSVQQLVGIHMVVENASNLLTKLIEWGRLAAYLEQSTRYIFFDEKDVNGKCKYYIPENLDPTTRDFYVRCMDRLFLLYSEAARGITTYLRNKYPEPQDRSERMTWINATRAQACDAVRPVLPVATQSTVGIFASAQALERMVMNLMSEPLPEAYRAGQDILREARKVIPVFLERADEPTRGAMIVAHRFNTRATIRDIAKRNLDFSKPSLPLYDARLVDYWPLNELDLVAEMLFEQAEPLSLSEVQKQVSTFDDNLKKQIFLAYMGDRKSRRDRPGRALEKAHFEWEIDGKDYGTFRDLQRHRIVDGWEWQRLSPVFGYEVPDLVLEAGFEDPFRECFNISSQLYEVIAQKDPVQAQYAVLFGHQMRYRFTMNLRQMFHFLELRTHVTGHPGYRKICNRIFGILKTVYPLSAQAMKFVNEGVDPELARLESEQATQRKLKKLGVSE